MNYYSNCSSQIQHPSNTSSGIAAAWQLKTEAAVVHQQPQGINSNTPSPSKVSIIPDKGCKDGSKNSIESPGTLYFPLPGELFIIYTLPLNYCQFDTQVLLKC